MTNTNLFESEKRKPLKMAKKTNQRELINSSVNHNKHYAIYSNNFTEEEKLLYGIDF